jgi:hypothetical protein
LDDLGVYVTKRNPQIQFWGWGGHLMLCWTMRNYHWGEEDDSDGGIPVSRCLAYQAAWKDHRCGW